MQTNYVMITDDNRSNFASVLPEGVYGGPRSVAIGATIGAGRLVAGAIVITQTEEEYLIPWLYVPEELRHMGIGRDLLMQANQFIEETGVMEVICQFPVEEEESHPLIHFFRSYHEEHSIIDLRFSHERFITEAKDFYSSPDVKGRHGGEGALRLFNQTMVYQKKALSMVEENLSILDKAEFDRTCIPELCLTTESGGVPTSILLSQFNGEYILLSYLYGKNPKDLYQILCVAAEEVEQHFADKKIIFDIVSTSAMALSEHFFKNANRVKIYEASW